MKSLKMILIISSCFLLITISAQSQAELKKNIEINNPTTELIIMLDNEMQAINAGSLQMGDKQGNKDERPEHTVKIDSFSISKYEITIEQYLLFLNAANVDSLGCINGVCYIDINDRYSAIAHKNGEFIFKKNKIVTNKNCPMLEVSWYGAYAFFNLLSENTNRIFRLPTEAQWEYACRVGTQTEFNTGDCINSTQANIRGIKKYKKYAKSEWLKKLAPVGAYKPNNWGLYNMHGNVAEWCLNVYTKSYEETNANFAKLEYGDQNEKVYRGGHWFYDASWSDSSIRKKENPNECRDYIGFRIAEIFGHTDSQGSLGYNQELSERRAKAVFAYLLKRGVPSCNLK